MPSVVGRLGAFGTGLLGISTVSEPPHPLTAKSGIASSPTIKSGLIVFRMNISPICCGKNTKCQENLGNSRVSNKICQDPDSYKPSRKTVAPDTTLNGTHQEFGPAGSIPGRTSITDLFNSASPRSMRTRTHREHLRLLCRQVAAKRCDQDSLK